MDEDLEMHNMTKERQEEEREEEKEEDTKFDGIVSLIT